MLLVSDEQEESCKLEENNVGETAAAMMSSLGKLKDSAMVPSKTQNGDSNHQDSNDSACHSDYDDSAIDENAKNVAKTLSQVNEKKTNALYNSTSAVSNGTEKEQEVIVIQENLFNVKINAPGVEPFEVQVSLR